MIISIVLLFAITVGGASMTYLFAGERRMMWRLAAGNIIGSAVFGLVAFLAASLVGFTALTIVVSLIASMLPLFLLMQKEIRKRVGSDWAKAKGTFQGASTAKLRRFAYYFFFFLVCWAFFGQTVYELADGLYTGGSQNLGDLPFHLGAIFSFTDGDNFPPQNPSWAGAKFSYPFIADFLSACFVRLGADLRSAIFGQNVGWAFSLVVILEGFVVDLTKSKLAGRLAPALLLFSGGLGFVWFFKDFWESGKGVLDFLWRLPKDYTIGDQFRWGNSMVVLFITQRSLLLGMPLTVLVLGYLWKLFATETTEEDEKSVPASPGPRVTASILVGLLAGTLPLIHLHSLAVLFVVTAFLFSVKPKLWREWVAFGVGVAAIAVPELAWSMSGSATETSKFFDWHFGWDNRDSNIFWFWLKNTGILIPVLIAGIYVVFSTWKRADAEKAKIEGQRSKFNDLLLFYLPFAFLFLVANLAKFAPWEWDNIKILIYWFIGSIPIITFGLAWAWERKGVWKIGVAVCFAALTMSGALDVWRTASGQSKIRVFDADAVKIAAQIKQKTPAKAIFLNAPTYNSAVVLSGRQSVMRYSGHLSSHGIDYGPRENDVKRIYQGGGVADILLKKYDVDYVLVSPEEKNSLKANEEFFNAFPVVAESGQYRVYKVKN